MWPIRFEDVERVSGLLKEWLEPTPLECYPQLDEWTGCKVFLKREDHNPTGSFKVRNGLAPLAWLAPEQKVQGVVAASRGNHGLGVAWAGRALHLPVTICVPIGNSATKNAGIRALGAELVEAGADYDESTQAARKLVEERGLREIHSTNEPLVIAGAATLTLEILGKAELDALVLAVGGGSQAVGALTVTRERWPQVEVYGVQAAGAAAIHDSWHAGRPMEHPQAETFADGLATRSAYPMTFAPLREGLTDFVKCTDQEIAEALRLLHRATGTAPEGAGAAGLAGLAKLRQRLAGKRVGVVMSGANIDEELLRQVLDREI